MSFFIFGFVLLLVAAAVISIFRSRGGGPDPQPDAHPGTTPWDLGGDSYRVEGKDAAHESYDSSSGSDSAGHFPSWGSSSWSSEDTGGDGGGDSGDGD